MQAWWNQIGEWRKKDCLKYDRDNREVIKPQAVVEALWRVTNGDAFITSDVGQHQMWAAQFYRFDKAAPLDQLRRARDDGRGPALRDGRQARAPGRAGRLRDRRGLDPDVHPGAVDLQAVRPAVKIVNLNNRYLGMVRQWQEIEYGSRYSSSYMEALPDFVRLAEAYGHVGIRVERPQDVEPALRDAFGKYRDRTVFLDIITDQTENVMADGAGRQGADGDDPRLRGPVRRRAR